MRDYVGVRSWLGASTTKSFPKREALLFNRIAVPYIGVGIQLLKQSDDPPRDFINELESLLEQGILFHPPIVFSPKLRENNEYRLYRELSSELEREMLEFMKTPEFRNTPVPDDVFDEIFRAIDSDKPALDSLSLPGRHLYKGFIHGDYEARRISVQLRELDNIQAFPILFMNPYSVQKEIADKTDVLHVVLNGMPIPDDSVPWEQIFDFRSDPDSTSSFLALRNWMSEIARAELTPIEIEEKLEHLIDKYQQHMRLHKMKTNSGTLETIIITMAEFLEDLVKFKWGKIAQGLFSFKHRRIALMEGELTAPGNEIAYIVKAGEEFS